MGAAQSSSPRTTTIDNPTGLFNITDDVVTRLKGQHANNLRAQQQQQQQSNPGSAPPTSSVNQTTIQPAAPTVSSIGRQPIASDAGHYNNMTTTIQNPIPLSKPSSSSFDGGATITALDVRRQKEQELRNNDAYWSMRLAQQENALQKTNSILEKEYDTAFESVRSRFQNAAPQHQLPPCKEFKERLIDCYKKHPNETLNCSAIVADFTNCVSMHRTKLLDKKFATANVQKTPAAA